MLQERHNTLVTWTVKKGVQQARNTPETQRQSGISHRGAKLQALDAASEEDVNFMLLGVKLVPHQGAPTVSIFTEVTAQLKISWCPVVILREKLFCPILGGIVVN